MGVAERTDGEPDGREVVGATSGAHAASMPATPAKANNATTPRATVGRADRECTPRV